jgi:hypothetical protein
MEPTDDPKLKNLLREWKVGDAPRSLDERVLGPRQSWWTMLVRGSVRVPVPVALCLAVLLVAMSAALVRSRTPPPVPSSPAVSSAINLADFRAVRDVQVRIMRSGHADQ